MELIKIETNENGEQGIGGRELHSFLEIETQYTKWFERMAEYGFTENIDYIAISQKRLTAQGNETTYTDHVIKLDMAKEISMLARNEKGKQARQYFIQIEKAWNTPELIMARALQVANNTVLNYKNKINILEEKIELDKPKVQFAEKLLDSGDVILIRDYAKILYEKGVELGEKKLYKWLRENKILMYNNIPYQKYMKYFKVVENVIKTFDGEIITTTTKINTDGQIYIYQKLLKEV